MGRNALRAPNRSARLGRRSHAAAFILCKEIGCDFVQGFYFSKPLPPEAVTMFLAKEHTS
jgi:hypothetical protein